MESIIACCPYVLETAGQECPYFKKGKKEYENIYSCLFFYDDGSIMRSDPCCSCKERIKELSLPRNRFQCKHRLTCKMWAAK